MIGIVHRSQARDEGGDGLTLLRLVGARIAPLGTKLGDGLHRAALVTRVGEDEPAGVGGHRNAPLGPAGTT